MSRHRRTITTILAALAMAVSAIWTSPVSGQVETELSELEARRDEIGNELAGIDAELQRVADEVAELETENSAARVQIELTADELERAVDSRREPASTRVEFAIAGFTNGDPRQSALIDEVLALQGSDESTRARELYSSVIEDAQDRLEKAEQRIRDATDQLTINRSSLADVADRLETANAERVELGTQRTELTLEQEQVVSRIDLIRSMENTAVLTGLSSFDDPTRPALAVKIDNVPAARPQAGINQADIVYVEEVEGGLTRLAAVFHSATPAQIGPVRSMRTGDFDLLGQFNSPLFSNSGGNRIARRLLADSSLVDIGAATHGDLYFRTSRPAPHNLFTNAGNVWAVGRGDEYPTGRPLPIFRFRAEGDPVNGRVEAASGATIDYGQTSVTYRWNGSGWDRSQDGGATVDTAGVRTAPTTVVLQFTEYVASPADPRSPEAVTTGQGEAWILTDGQVTKGFWRRNAAAVDQPIEYVDGNGNFISILPGRTWVEMPRSGRVTLN